MKKFSLISVLIILISVGFAQTWKNNLPKDKTKSELTFFDYQDAFNEHWNEYKVKNGWYIDDDGNKQKAYGWKQFKRWEYHNQSRVNPVTGEFPKTSAFEQYNKHIAKYGNYKSENGNWQSLGTNYSTSGYAGIGRINSIAFHPTDDNIFWIAAPAGGLWFTDNEGTTWTPLTDNNEVIGISSIIIPSNYESSQTIYIGTGDRDAFDNYSTGVLKSTDQGASWNTTGLSFIPADNEVINILLLDPENDSKIYAATSAGLYVTEDGADNWNILNDIEFIDIEFKAGNTDYMYATTREGEIYRSTNNGINWEQVFTSGTGNRIELAVSANNTNIVYAIVSNTSNGLLGIYKSGNSGESYELVFDDYNLLGWDAGGSGNNGQAWYDLALAADPNNANILFCGGVNTWRSIDGGETWNIMSHWSGGGGVQAVHADKHCFKFRNNTSVMFDCNDGGVYKTENGTNWTDLSNGLTISQIYRIGVSQTVVDETIAGLQDNGTKLRSNGTWEDVVGGDGMECIVDFTDENIQYGSLYYGAIYKTSNHWASGTEITTRIPGGANGAWITPYTLAPNDNNIIYIGYSTLWKSSDQGNNFTNIGNFGSNLQSLAVAPSNQEVIYTANYNEIYKTNNGGNDWQNITNGLPVSTTSIKYISVKNDNSDVVWLALSGYNGDGVYETIDGGASWTNISEGLPEIPVNCIVQNKLETTNVQLYAGTDFGVYIKNGTDSWTLFNNGLPNVVVSELEIYYDFVVPENSLLRAATYGRGLWESDINLSGNYAPATITGGIENITINSADVSGEIIENYNSPVTSSGIIFSTDNNLNIGEEGVTIVETSPVVTDGTFTVNLTDLQTGTTYYYRSFAENGNGLGYGNILSFVTECEIINTFTWSEDFENNGSMPDCFTEEFVSGDNISWEFYDGGQSGVPEYAHSGIYNLTLKDIDVANDETLLILPKMDLGELSNAILQFWHAQSSLFSFQDELSVLYKNSPEDEWTEIITYSEQIDEWTERTIYLPNLSSEYSIAFKGNARGGKGICIDDMSVSDVSEIKENVNNDIQFFPNPTTGIIIITTKLNYKNIVVDVKDINGKRIFDKNFKKSDDCIIDLSNNPQGIYFIEIDIDNKKYIEKIVLK